MMGMRKFHDGKKMRSTNPVLGNNGMTSCGTNSIAITSKATMMGTVREVLGKFDAQALRYLLLTTHYRSPINFSDQLVHCGGKSGKAFPRRVGAHLLAGGEEGSVRDFSFFPRKSKGKGERVDQKRKC